MEFQSLSELYAMIRPALISKKTELRHKGITYVKEEDLWNYLKETKWKKTSDLSLSDMVNDIFNVIDSDIESYVKNKMNEITRQINLEEIK